MTYATRSTAPPEFSSPDGIERVFICCLLLEPTNADGLLTLTPDAFQNGRHRIIFQAIRDIALEGGIPTADAVQARLEALGRLERAGGPAYLITISQETFGPSMRPAYLRY